MSRPLTVLTCALSFGLGYGTHTLIHRDHLTHATPDAVVVNYPTGGLDKDGNEKRDYQTLTVVPDHPDDGERGLWFVKLKSGEHLLAQYRCRPHSD